MLNSSKTGYRMKKEIEKIISLLYIDDLKIIAKNNEELAHELEVVKAFSGDIQVEFGIEKCAIASCTEVKT